MGTTFGDAAKAAAIFSKHGVGVAETLKRTSAALHLARTSGMSYKIVSRALPQ